ncbi:MAG TPA: hypothetical protein PLZ86_01015 [bacterium]|nr:hypothetical protein [bacterium]
MAESKEKSCGLILSGLMEQEGESASPAVLSCGGIYIPHRGRQDEILSQIITTSCREEPVKVVTGVKPRNILREVLLRESMN